MVRCLPNLSLLLCPALIVLAACGSGSKATSSQWLALPPAADGAGTDAWWAATAPCPDEGELRGHPPPKGLHVWCMGPDHLPHGRSTEWHRTGTLKADGSYRHGARHGEWRQWNTYGDSMATEWVNGTRAPEPDECYLEVKVVDRTTGIGLPNALVAITCDQSRSPPGSVGTTDVNGYVQLGPMEPDTCTVNVLLGGSIVGAQLVELSSGVMPVEVRVR